MFDRFTERARKVVVLAQAEAAHFGHAHIGTEHLLGGLMREGDGVAARALRSLGVTDENVRLGIQFVVGRGEGKSTQAIFTPHSRKVCDYALREALQLGHNYIGTEHLLLGLLRVEEGVGYHLLARQDVKAASVRKEVIRLLGGGRSRGGRGHAAYSSNVVALDATPRPIVKRRGLRAARSFSVGPLQVSGRIYGKRLIAEVLWRNSRYASVKADLPTITIDRTRWKPQLKEDNNAA